MSRPESRPEAVAARIRRDVDLITAARQLGLPADEDHTHPYSEADEEWVDRAVATTCPVTRERWVPARRWGR